MDPIDIVAIEQEARRLRAAEMRRLERICAERMGIYLRLLGASLLRLGTFVSQLLQPLFSWVPQDHKVRLP